MNVEEIAVERARAILDAAGVKYTLSLGGNGKQEAPSTAGISARYGVNVVLHAMEVGDKTHFDVPDYDEGVTLSRRLSSAGGVMYGKGVIKVSHTKAEPLRVYAERIK